MRLTTDFHELSARHRCERSRRIHLTGSGVEEIGRIAREKVLSKVSNSRSCEATYRGAMYSGLENQQPQKSQYRLGHELGPPKSRREWLKDICHSARHSSERCPPYFDIRIRSVLLSWIHYERCSYSEDQSGWIHTSGVI